MSFLSFRFQLLSLFLFGISYFPIASANGNFSHTSGKSLHDFYRGKQHLEENAKNPLHTKTWHDMKEVNGLKNEEVVIFITSSTTREGRLLWERIIPSARTWMRMFANVFTVVEDNFMIRYALRHCRHRDYRGYTTFKCYNEPTYLLTRRCTDEYYVAAGICCKVDAILDFTINDNRELFHSLKYVMIGDDDTYFRAEPILKWLAAVDKSGVANLPITGNANPTKEDHGIWHINNCKEIRATGWYQPMMLNKAALEKMAIASAAYGLTDLCKDFVLSQDVGLETYMWLFGVYHILIPNVAVNGEHYGYSVFKPNQLIVHSIKHEVDNCKKGDESQWPDRDRYDQRIAVGCGDIDHPGPFHNSTKMAGMYDAWNYFLEHGESEEFGKEGEYEFEKRIIAIHPRQNQNDKMKVKEILPKETVLPADRRINGDEVVEAIIPRLQFIDGYSKTKHAQSYDIVHKEWHLFGMKDCDPPGTFQ